jgi:hypothetical protein
MFGGKNRLFEAASAPCSVMSLRTGLSAFPHALGLFWPPTTMALYFRMHRKNVSAQCFGLMESCISCFDQRVRISGCRAY